MLQKSKTELRSGKPSRDEYPSLPKHKIVVVLDNPNSAFNIGVIFRVSEALLLEKICLCGECPLPNSRKFKSTAKSADRWMAWEHKDSTLETILELKSAGYEIVSTELANGSIIYKEARYSYPVAFVFGNEKNGISEDVLGVSDKMIHLPMYGMANSLNVSSTASVVLYDAVGKIR